MKDELALLRQEIDGIDEKITELLKSRMTLSLKVAEYKMNHEMEIYVPEREKQLLERIKELSGEIFNDYILKIYESILAQSRECQQKKISVQVGSVKEYMSE